VWGIKFFETIWKSFSSKGRIVTDGNKIGGVTTQKIQHPSSNYEGLRFLQAEKKLAEVEYYPDFFAIYWPASISAEKFAKEVEAFVLSFLEVDPKVTDLLSYAVGVAEGVEEEESVGLERVLSVLQQPFSLCFANVYTPFGDIWSEFQGGAPKNATPMCGITSNYNIKTQVMAFFLTTNRDAKELTDSEIEQLRAQLSEALARYPDYLRRKINS
jgi:hypothetical protein